MYIYTYIYVCVSVCMCACVCVCVYVYTYIHECLPVLQYLGGCDSTHRYNRTRSELDWAAFKLAASKKFEPPLKRTGPCWDF